MLIFIDLLLTEGATKTSQSTSALAVVWINIPVIIFIGCSSVIIIVTILCCYKCKREKVSTTTDPIYDIPMDIAPDIVQMTQSEAYGVTTQKPFAMSECNAYKL